MSEIRISCASLASIKIDNKYLLLLNKRSYKQGKMVYTPIGGALEYHPNGKKFLDNLEVRYERETPDLRFKMDSENLDLFRCWFENCINRENDITRELIEEMVDEEKIFKSLDLKDFTTKYIRTETPIKEIDGVSNYFFFEIYKVTFTKDKITEIKEYIKKNNDKIILVSDIEIKNGFTKDNIEIGDNAKSILND